MNKNQIRIMLIEDNPGDFRLIHEMLKTTAVQFKMDYSDQLSKGLKLLEMKEFDVLILDLGLPDCQGLETLKKTRAKVSGIPIVVLTGLADEAIGIRAIQDGAQDYLVKGQIDGNLLARTIRYSIERKRIEKELQKAHDELECRVKERTAELAILNDQLKAEIEIRKQVERSLQESKERYRTVADFTYDWEDWLDPNGKYIYVSPSCEWITGYRPDEFVSYPDIVIKITHPDDRDLVEKHFDEVLRGSIGIHHIDFRIVNRNGIEYWISHYCQPVYSKEGKFLGRRSSNRDITKRKQAEKELIQLTGDLQRLNVELANMNAQLKAEIEIRMKTEKELKESEERYKKMVGAITTYTYSVDISRVGAISTQHSMGCISVTGYNPEDYEADPHLWYSIIYPDDKMIIENAIKELLAGHRVPPIEHRIIHHDGKVVYVRNTIVPYYDIGGRLVRYDGLIEDITERKRAEEQILRQRAVLEGSNKVLREALTCETETDIALKCLAVAEELTGSKFGFICEINQAGRFDTIAISDPGWDACRIPKTNAVLMLNDLEIRGIRGRVVKDERSMISNDPASHPDWVEPPENHPPITCFLGVPLKHGDKTIGMIGLANKERDYDLADQQVVEALSVAFVEALYRRRAEEEIQKLNRRLEQHILELTEANKELDAFNYSVSHDLQNPLVVIGGFTSRFLKIYGDKLDANGKDMFCTIHMHTQKMERLIKDLLAFSHAGRQQIKPTEIDIGNLITTVLDELRTLSDGRMIKFDIKTLPPCYGDMALIKQVLINLLSNAIKFTRPKDMGVIEIGCRVEKNENIYYVKDNGIGFYSQFVDELFSPFRRLHGTKEFEGTGVGLSIVQRIINRHGGRVWAEGKVNEGATFYFSLPRKDVGHS